MPLLHTAAKNQNCPILNELNPLLLCRVITDTLRTRETTAVTGMIPCFTFRFYLHSSHLPASIEFPNFNIYDILQYLNMSPVSAVNDWKYAAIVLDRVCLLTFTLFTLIATVVLFSAAPHILVT